VAVEVSVFPMNSQPWTRDKEAQEGSGHEIKVGYSDRRGNQNRGMMCLARLRVWLFVLRSQVLSELSPPKSYLARINSYRGMFHRGPPSTEPLQSAAFLYTLGDINIREVLLITTLHPGGNGALQHYHECIFSILAGQASAPCYTAPAYRSSLFWYAVVVACYHLPLAVRVWIAMANHHGSVNFHPNHTRKGSDRCVHCRIQ